MLYSLLEQVNINYQINYEHATTTYTGATKLISISQLKCTAILRVRRVIGIAVWSVGNRTHLSAIKE